MTQSVKDKGRKLTYLLRHSPKEFGIELNEAGWGNVEKILLSLDLKNSELELIVKNDNKNRFSFSPDGLSIRANQGHSIPVNLGLDAVQPPKYLYHGTVQKFMHLIKKEGLRKISRHHVHLSSDLETATQVASRRQTDSVILIVKSLEMMNDGYEFFLSDNGVWLTDSVPARFLIIKEGV